MMVTREPHPKATLPTDRQAQIWRYMDFWKFESLLKNRALYLCRGDKLQDRFEGTYSRQQIAEMDRWLGGIGYAHLIEEERSSRQRRRKQFFINSWCISDHDLDLMWKAYTCDALSIAIQSTIARLELVADAAIEYWPVDVSMVSYVNKAEGQPIDYVDGFDPFIHKDVHFELDREIRLLHWPNVQEPIPDGVFLPVDLTTLIERIVLHPQFKTESMNILRTLLQEAKLRDILLEVSRDERLPEEVSRR